MKSSIKLILICLTALFLPFLSYGQWSEIKIPFGFDIENSFVDHKGNIFARTHEYFFFFDRTEQKWSKMDFPIPFYLEFDLSKEFRELDNHDIIYKAKNDLYKYNPSTKNFDTYINSPYSLVNIDYQGFAWYIYKENNNNIGLEITKDKGATYKLIDIPANLSSCQINKIESYKDQYNLCTICCDDNCYLYKFNDSGNFKNLGSLTSSYADLFINPNTGTIFYLKDDVLVRSIDGGQSFIPVNITNNTWLFTMQMRLNAGVLTLQNGNGFYYSIDDGKNWTEIFQNDYKLPYGFTPGSIGLLGSTDSIIVLNKSCGIQGNFLSTDNGKSWLENKERLYIPQINKIVENKNCIFAFTCSDTSVLKSTDKGLTWSSFNVKFNNQQFPIYDLNFSEDGQMLALTKSGLFKSDNDGITFIKLPVPESAFTYYNSYFLLASKSGNYFLVDPDNLSYKSNDYGLTWNGFPYSNNFSSHNFKLDNEGNIWELSDINGLQKYNTVKNESEFFPLFIYNRCFHVSEYGMIYFLEKDLSTNNLFLGVSKDNMKSYKKISLSYIQFPSNLFSDSDNNIYINAQDGIYRSFDEGENFELFASKPEFMYSYMTYVSAQDRLLTYDDYPEIKIYEWDKNLAEGILATGTVFYDDNNDCTRQIQELKIPGICVNIQGGNNKKVFTNAYGECKFRIDEGTYSLIAKSPNDLWESCLNANINILPNQTDPVSFDLGLKAKTICSYLTLDLQIPIMRRCFDNNIYLKYCNEGTEASENTQFKITLPEKMTYLSSSVTPTSINGNELTFDLGELSIGECGQIALKANLSCDAEINELICVDAVIGPALSCANELPDLANIRKCIKTVGSIDPNDKTAFINGKPANGKSDKNQDVDYLIRFQNTGTDTAFRIVVVDDIPEGYDISSLKILNSSHPFNMQLSGERTMKFTFDPIMLPDSNINEPASHGFIAFRISPNEDLPYGTELNNYANIFFDFNAPVTTNTEYLTVTNLTSTSGLKDNLIFSYYPNPTKGELNIEVINEKSQYYTLRVTDLLGKELVKETYKGASYKMSGKSLMLPGIYFINIESEDGKRVYGKFVVE